MTRAELEALFGPEEHLRLNQAFVRARKASPEFDRKISRKHSVDTSMSLDDVMFLCSFVRPPYNPIELALVRENYVSHDKTYIQLGSVWKEGTERFVERLSRDRNVKACANCAYLHGRTLLGHGVKLHPWCAFYKRYSHHMRVTLKNRERTVDIFKDRCPSYLKGDVKYFER